MKKNLLFILIFINIFFLVYCNNENENDEAVLKINEESLTIMKDKTAAIIVTALKPDKTLDKITVNSSDNNIVKVSTVDYYVDSLEENTGKVESYKILLAGLSEGSAKITIISEEGLYAKCSVLVDIPDTQDPILKNIYIESAAIDKSGIINIHADATDNKSGISHLCIYYEDPDGDEYFDRTYLKYNNNSKLFEGSLKISEYDKSGLWKIKRIYLKDKADNVDVYSIDQYSSSDYYYHGNRERSDFSIIEFTVSNTTPDQSNPWLESISIDKNYVTGPDVINIALKAYDSVSGINTIQLNIKGPKRIICLHPVVNGGIGSNWTIPLSPGSTEPIYEIIEIEDGNNDGPDHYAIEDKGEWIIERIILIDNVGNRKDYASKECSQNELCYNEIDSLPVIKFTYE